MKNILGFEIFNALASTFSFNKSFLNLSLKISSILNRRKYSVWKWDLMRPV